MERSVSDDELSHPDTGFWEAQAIVAAAAPLPPRPVPLQEGLGKASAHDVHAPRAVPGFRAAAMDGYAVRSSDCQIGSVTLPVAGVVNAGDGRLCCAPGTAVKVMTGARVPDGADSVIPWEHTDLGRQHVAIQVRPTPGQHVRGPDDEVAPGQLIVPAGGVVTPAHLAAAAASGLTSLLVVPSPRVAILTTGDELVAGGLPLSDGQITDSNGPLLAAFVAQAGATVVAYARVGDDPSATEAKLRHLASVADVVVTTGGVSTGERDWVRSTMEHNGEVAFWRVGMRPGRPLLYGRFDGTPVLCLPGTPSGVLTGAYLFLGPLLDALAGRPARPRARVPAAEAVAGLAGRVQLLPGWVDGAGNFRALLARHPGLGRLATTDGLAIVESHGASATDLLEFVPFEPRVAMSNRDARTSRFGTLRG